MFGSRLAPRPIVTPAQLSARSHRAQQHGQRGGTHGAHRDCELNVLSKFRRGFEIAGGLTLIVMGLYMLNAVYFWIPEFAI